VQEGARERFDDVLGFGLHGVVFGVHLHLLVDLSQEVFVEEGVRPLGHASNYNLEPKFRISLPSGLSVCSSDRIN
jgi:hypothetical protein